MEHYPPPYPAHPETTSPKRFDRFREDAQKKEELTLCKSAAYSRGHSRCYGDEIDHRLPYKRDVDRIVHSKAYSRYIDKTQVVYLIENDHITHRGLHVQLVSNFARGVAEILRLNLDLVEAISLGHDVGHPPFGHEGEGYLSELSVEYGGPVFAHPWQSCRLFTKIEPINLGFAVYDGFLCHDGGMQSNRFRPRFGKTWEEHFQDLEQKLAAPDRNIIPATLEGCLVKLSDTISYLGRDIEDAISLRILDRKDVPQTCLGMFNRDILRHVACDIIENSYEKDYIAISEEVYEALHRLRAFNFEKIYTHPKLKVESEKVKISYRILLDFLLEDYERKGENSYLYRYFLCSKTDDYLSETKPLQMAVDFIAGMTDSYFVRTLEKVMVPKRIEIR